ncbi:3-isopropylmalate dehydratase small subunit [Roseomonas terrae]|jgi:3-isopropylmalate/(R)-2-methylmalate dehydratase small subunit|uniref:3-isopropylmalate dehydratase small subunit n=1 Tax=Neoroseomonas terrae TaxID=424799 RepID=A0ABS5EC96_9PROT|nr:3-isopropylmalate dehydratase small subunit [Neoroseomonas terrae]MBR0648640.1 3-isopropylmalate dehydratase small subunit [Neoroseomonas terrae]
MEPFTLLTGIAAPLDRPNVDTDQIAPARFLRRPRKEGYRDILFHDLRFSAPGEEYPDFVLNQPAFRQASILVADRNFGGGSSREQAVWSLVDYGIRCVIAESFGDIFWENSVKGGLLLIRQDEATLAGWRDQLRAAPGSTMSIDLDAQTISQPDGTSVAFEVEIARKRRLLLGLDDIGITLRHQDAILTAETAYRARHPWLFDRAAPG